MITGMLFASAVFASGMGRWKDAGLYVLLGFVALVVLFLIFFAIVCLTEKQYLSGDVESVSEPFPYPPLPYWHHTCANAVEIGLRRVGDYATCKNTSKVRGLETLFLSEDGTILVTVVGAKSFLGKTKKTVLRTRLTNGTVLESSDSPISRDVTGVIQLGVLMNAGVLELTSYHLQRIKYAGSQPVAFRSGAEMAESEQIQLERGQRLVDAGLARWVNAEQTQIRMTLRGAMAMMKDLFVHGAKLQDQSSRMDIKRAG